MGQQQLLLLVLGIVIVGIAIVVGINAYSENSVKSNFDAILQDGLRIASDAQSWKSKPELFGGSADTTKPVPGDFLNVNPVDFIDLGYSPDLILDLSAGNVCYNNTNGTYELTPAATELTIVGANVANQNQVTIEVNGTLEADVDLIETSSFRGGFDVATGAAAGAAIAAPCP